MGFVVHAAAAGIASMGGADSGVVGTAGAADEWVVAAASTLVAGFVVAAAAEVAVRVGVACASREVVELMVAAAGIATDEVDEDCVVVVVGSVAVAAGPHRPGSYRLDCCTAGRRAGLVVELAVSQASFGIPRRAVSGWRCRSTVRSVERAGAADGKLVTRANEARGSASVVDAGSHAAAVVAERFAAVALRGERSR